MWDDVSARGVSERRGPRESMLPWSAIGSRARIVLVLFGVVAGSCSSSSPSAPINGDLDDLFQGLGAVTITQTSCPVGALKGTSCLGLEVTCPTAVPILAEIRYTPPAAGVPLRGTVVFGTGGSGRGFLEDDGAPLNGPVVGMLRRTTELGFAVVQRRWANQDVEGWFVNDQGMLGASCRYATLVTWIWRQYHEGAAFCAVGFSAGSAEIAYALARWSRSNLIDFAMLNSGPPLTRVDFGCLGEVDPRWLQACTGLDLPGTTCSQFSCVYDESESARIDAAFTPVTPCADRDESLAARFWLDSIAGPGAQLDFPNTPLHFLFGDQDCGVAVPQGLAFLDLVQSRKAMDLVPETDHRFQLSERGRQAVLDALRSECVARP